MAPLALLLHRRRRAASRVPIAAVARAAGAAREAAVLRTRPAAVAVRMRAAGSGGANLRAALRCLGADRAPRIVPPRKTKIVERQLPTATDPPPVANGGKQSTHLSV